MAADACAKCSVSQRAASVATDRSKALISQVTSVQLALCQVCRNYAIKHMIINIFIACCKRFAKDSMRAKLPSSHQLKWSWSTSAVCPFLRSGFCRIHGSLRFTRVWAQLNVTLNIITVFTYLLLGTLRCDPQSATKRWQNDFECFKPLIKHTRIMNLTFLLSFFWTP